MVLVACQNMGGSSVAECVQGFVKTKNGTCKSVKSLSSEELAEADSRLSTQISASEAELATRRETKKMIDTMKAAEETNRRQQMAQYQQSQMQSAQAQAADQERLQNQVNVHFLDENTTPARNNTTVNKAAFRAELQDSFNNERNYGNSGRGNR